jgi:mRNA interferase MazF
MFPFSDLTSTKRRPAVVLWASADQNDFALAFISSQNATTLTPGEMALLSTHGEFGLLGLTASSKVRATKIVSLHRTLITRYMGRLGPLLTADLDRALTIALGINTVPIREAGREEERKRLAELYIKGGSDGVLGDLGLI